MKRKLLSSVWKMSKITFSGFLLSCCFSSMLWASEISGQSIREIYTSVSLINSPISEVLTSLEESTGLQFIYNPQKVDLDQKLSVELKNASMLDILTFIAENGQLRFKQINQNILVKAHSPIFKAVDLVTEETATGILAGKVLDGITKEPLPGAAIRVVGTNLGTVTNLSGEYKLVLEAGEITLEVSYLGFDKQTFKVTIPADGNLVFDVELTNSVVELADVTIVGNLDGQQKALNQQKNAANIINVVAAEQIGRFPDPNVAEALQRIPGANIQRDQGEGRYVQIRGLAPQFTNISINGEQIPSPEAGVRFVALDAVPADQLASIEVSKAITPDMDGDAVGGAVNLITRKAKTDTPSISATLLGGYNHWMQQPYGQGSLQYGQRFLDSKLGVMLNASYYFSDRGSDNWEQDGGELELRDYQLRRTRMGLSATIDYKLNPNSELYFRAMHNKFTDREWRRTYLFVPNQDDSPFEDNEIERAVKDRYEAQVVNSYNLGGNHTFSKFFVNYEVAFAEAYQDTPYDNEGVFIAGADGINIDFETNPEFPTFNVEGINYLDNSNYAFDEIETGGTYAYDRNITGKVNFGIPYQLGAANAVFKFGGKVRLKEKSFTVTQNVFEWAGADDLILSDFEGGLHDTDFLDNRYQLSPNLDLDRFFTFFNSNRSGFELQTEDKLAAEAAESYTAKEDVYAGYLMTELNWDKLTILGGFRYEKTNVEYTFNTVQFGFDGDLESITPETGATDYNFFLPQLHLKYQVNEYTNLRAAATMSYSRPNFEDIVPTQEIELADRAGTIGNANLKPVAATNLDLFGEKYFGTVGVLSAGVFYKKLDDFIYTRNFRQQIEGVNVLVRQAINGESASLFGVELAYQQNLTFLPGALKGLGVYANYTYTQSAADIQLRDQDNLELTEEIRLPGQAEHVGNFSLSYDYKGFNTRIALNFNGKYLEEVGEAPDEDIFVKERMQLDWTVRCTINPKFRVFAEFMNLTNQPLDLYMGSEKQFIQREFYDWWTRIGVKFDF